MNVYLVCSVFTASLTVFASPGEWPEPRHDAHLTGIQTLPGAMKMSMATSRCSRLRNRGNRPFNNAAMISANLR